MAEIPDVVPGEPIEAAWGNPIRDRTAQRYLDASDRDLRNPIPTDGDLAFLEDTGTLQVRSLGAWLDLQTAGLGDNFWLRLDAANAPVTNGFDIEGNVRLRSNDALFALLSPNASLGYELAANVNDGGLGDLDLQRENGGSILWSVDPSGRVRIRQAVSVSAVRNVHQSTSDPSGGDGIDGDVWLTYS